MKNDVPVYSTHNQFPINLHKNAALWRILGIVWTSCELKLASPALDEDTSLKVAATSCSESRIILPEHAVIFQSLYWKWKSSDPVDLQNHISNLHVKGKK